MENISSANLNRAP